VEQHDLILSQEDAINISQYLARFIVDTGVRTALLMGRDGYLLAQEGKCDVSVESLCALAVGAFASSEALAHLSGEESFNSIYHQGVRQNVLISLVDDSHLLLALFDYNAGAPLVRLQARMTAEQIVTVLERAYQHTNAARSGALSGPTS